MSKGEGGLFPDYTKAQRVIELYRRIRCGLATTKKEEAEVFGVSEETIKNYIEELRSIWGVDIKYKGGKYVLLNEGALGHLKSTYPLTTYDAVIILTTLMQAAPFMETKIEIIKSTLLSILPEEDAKLFRRVFHEPHMSIVSTSEVEKNIQIIIQAISKGKCVSITYRGADGTFSNHIYNPYTMAYDQGKYYLIARRDDKESIIHLRLDRIKLMTIVEKDALKITNLEVSEYLKKTWYMYGGDETRVRVKFKNQCKKVVLERKINQGIMIEEHEEYFIYEFICNGIKGIKLWLMGFGEEVEILAPMELREEIKESVFKMMKIYSNG